MVWINPRFKKFWEPASVADAGALPLPGYKRRAWYSIHPFYIDRVGKDWTNRPHNAIFFTLIAYVREDETLFEVRTREELRSTDSTTVPFEVMEALVNGAIESGISIQGLNNATIRKIGGRALVNLGRQELTRHTIYRTPLGYLCGEFGGAFAFMLRYPDKVKTFEAGKVVEKEMTTLSSSWSRLNGSSDDYDKNRWLERMAATQRELEKCEVQFENTCNDAAEAINALSDEFGIEIAI